MAQIINTNMASIGAQMALDNSSSTLQTSLARLSSGLRINSSKDDAAGMAIASRMTTQVRGLQQAGRNANDGISLAQTAEGGLSNIQDALQRIRELAVQSSNATNSATDRASLNSEATQLVAEIQRISTTTNFNGVTLLDGSFTSKAFQIGANAGQTINITAIANAQTTALGVGTNTSFAASTLGSDVDGFGISAGALALNGTVINQSSSDGLSAFDAKNSAIAVAAAINATGTNATATVVGNTLSGTVASGFGTSIGAGTIQINGVDLGAIAANASITERAGAMAAAVNAKASLTGVTATFDSTAGTVTLAAADGRNISTTFSTACLTTTTGLSVGTNTSTNTTVAEKVNSGFNSVVLTAFASIGANTLSVNGYDIGSLAATLNVSAETTALMAAINALTSKTGVTAALGATGAQYTLTSATGAQIELKAGGAGVVSGTSAAAFNNGTGITAMSTATTRTITTYSSVNVNSTASGGLTVADISGTASAHSGLAVGNTSAALSTSSGISTLDLTTANGATAAITVVDAALATVVSARGTLGAIQNRFIMVTSNVATGVQNVTAARSRIQDTDFAAETANLSRAQILVQAGTAMLAQANSLPQSVLSLLK